jgi:hypothetical protein
MWPYIEWENPESATGEASEFYKQAGQSLIMRCLSVRPDFGKAISTAAKVVHFSDGSLSRRDHELIATYVSALNHCPF